LLALVSFLATFAARAAADMPKPIEGAYRLLEADEPPAFVEINPNGVSAFVIAVDHASSRIPRRLGTLGLDQKELTRHIAWDIGALAVARRVSALLDAPLLAQNYSRLVIDCNRDPDVAASIPSVGELTPIPGNAGLSAEEVAARRVEIFEPYHRAIRRLLDARQASGRPAILVAQHSMTNILKGVSREMHAAILYNRDPRFAHGVLEALRRDPSLHVADNQPYFVSDQTDYTIPRHGEALGLLHVEIEIRQDLISNESGQMQWAARIASALEEAEGALSGGALQD
jgi:predicted N-formylglutamate amidohydrolase